MRKYNTMIKNVNVTERRPSQIYPLSLYNSGRARECGGRNAQGKRGNLRGWGHFWVGIFAKNGQNEVICPHMDAKRARIRITMHEPNA